MTTQVYKVSGMTCQHCVASVTEEVSTIDGVTQVTVALDPEGVSEVTVDSQAELDLEAVRAAVDEAGYELVG